VNSDNWRRIEAPRFSPQWIVQTAEELTRNYVRATNPDPALFTMNFDHVYEHYIYPEYGIVLEEGYELGHDAQGAKILGTFDFETNVAYLDAILGPPNRDPRRIFTCWHEVGGHGILQGSWFRRELARSPRSRYAVTTEWSIDRRTEHTLERQANLFAAHAAAPTWFLRQVLGNTYEATRPVRYTGPGRYCLSVNRTTVFRDANDFDHLCQIVAYYISSRFGGLSLEALGYRLAEIGFVADVSRAGFRLRRVASAPAPVRAAAPGRSRSGSSVLAAVGS
jgi:hypothetical protein